jgi:hypothetical protein
MTIWRRINTRLLKYIVPWLPPVIIDAVQRSFMPHAKHIDRPLDKIGLPYEVAQVGSSPDAVMLPEEKCRRLEDYGACKCVWPIPRNVINRVPVDNFVPRGVQLTYQRHQPTFMGGIGDAVEICGMFVFEALLYELLQNSTA